MSKTSKVPSIVQACIDANDNPLMLIDDHYTIVGVNAAFRETFGDNGSAGIGRKCFQVSHGSEVPCHMNGEDCPHKAVFETGKPHQVLHVHHHGEGQLVTVRVKGFPIGGEDGQRFLGEVLVPVTKAVVVSSKSDRMVGRAPAFLKTCEELVRAAEQDSPVLISGETGSGKGLAARYVHDHSKRQSGPFVTFDCTAVSERTFEDEFFGHERGAFTGCVGRRHGMVEQADGGTIFLDEVGEVPLSLQPRLLGLLDSGQFRRIGGREMIKANIRIVASTSRDLHREISMGKFRADLFYRLASSHVGCAPLRERKEDIPLLVRAFLEECCDSKNSPCRVTPEAMEKLAGHVYPGNIRELRNVVRRAASIAHKGTIEAVHIEYETPLDPVEQYAIAHPSEALNGQLPSVGRIELDYISTLLKEHHGHRAKVARVLGISERTLYRSLKEFGLESQGR
jgi:DNA-binding NtrC family response regulator